MKGLESTYMPNDSDQEIDTSASSFNNPLDGNDSTHPLEIPLNRSGEIPNGSSEGPSPLIGRLDTTGPERKHTPPAKPTKAEDKAEPEAPKSSIPLPPDDWTKLPGLPAEISGAAIQDLTNEDNRDWESRVENIKHAPLAELTGVGMATVPTTPGPHTIDDILNDPADIQDLTDRYGLPFIQELRRGGNISDLPAGELKRLTDKHGAAVMKAVEDLASSRGRRGRERGGGEDNPQNRFFEAEMQGNPVTRFSGLAKVEGGEQQARQILEDFINVFEEREEEVEGSRANQMLHAIDRGLTWAPGLRMELMTMLQARFKYHNAAIFAQFDGGKKLAQSVSEIRQVEHNAILEMAGVRQAIAMLEENDGLYFRLPTGNPTMDVTTDPDTLGHEVGMLNIRNPLLEQKKVDFLSGRIPGGVASLSDEERANYEEATRGIVIGTGPDQYSVESIRENIGLGQNLNLNDFGDQLRIAIRSGLITRAELAAMSPPGTGFTQEEQIEFIKTHPLSMVVAEKINLMVRNLEYSQLTTDEQRAEYLAPISDDEKQSFLNSRRDNEAVLNRVPAEIEKRLRLDSARRQVDKAFSMAEKASQLFMVAATSDGPRFKQTDEQIKKNEPGTLIQTRLDPVVIFDVREEDIKVGAKNQLAADHYEIHINGPLSDEQQAQLNYVRQNQNFRIGMAWDQAWIGFFQNHFEEIDVANSVGSNGGRVGSQMFNLVGLEKPGTPNPGRAVPLRRLGFGGAEGVLNMTGRTSIADQMEHAYDDRNIIGLRWAPRIEGVVDYNSSFGKFIDDPNAIYSEDLKSLNELLGQLKSYVPQEERLIFGEYLTEGILDFLKNDYDQYFKGDNLDTADIRNRTWAARNHDFISEDARKRIDDKVLGPFGELKYQFIKMGWRDAFWYLLSSIVSGKVK